MITEKEVNSFLKEFKEKMKIWDVLFRDDRGKTRCTFGSPSDDGYLVRETADALIYF